MDNSIDGDSEADGTAGNEQDDARESGADERGARVEAADRPGAAAGPAEARESGGTRPPERRPGPSAPAQPPPPAVPRVLCDTRAATADPPPRPGVLWKLAEPGRQLDANLVHLPPGSSVAAHAEHDLDVALLAVAGSGTLGTGPGGTDESLTPGALAWLPRGATRSLSAGPEGLSYVTVHRARPGLSVRPRPEGWQVMGG